MKSVLRPAINIVSVAVCAIAQASVQTPECEYVLVGLRHAYVIGPDRDAHVSAREEIEKDYADRLSAEQRRNEEALGAGADYTSESQRHTQALAFIADERDRRMSTLFEPRDDLKNEYPELNFTSDSVYQVIGIQFHSEGQSQILQSVTVFKPWPDYVAPQRGGYGGWVYDVAYEPAKFAGIYGAWRGGMGQSRFFDGFNGHNGLIHLIHPYAHRIRSAGSRPATPASPPHLVQGGKCGKKRISLFAINTVTNRPDTERNYLKQQKQPLVREAV